MKFSKIQNIEHLKQRIISKLKIKKKKKQCCLAQCKYLTSYSSKVHTVKKNVTNKNLKKKIKIPNTKKIKSISIRTEQNAASEKLLVREN